MDEKSFGDIVRRNIRVVMAVQDRKFAAIAEQASLHRSGVAQRYKLAEKHVDWWADVLDVNIAQLTALGDWLVKQAES